MAPLPRPGAPGAARLLAGYRPLPGIADEVIAPDGAMRPVWGPFLEALAAMPGAARADRFARAAQYLRDAGVYFRQYGETGSTEREWPLSPLPVLVSDTDWQAIEAGLSQRADLLEAVMADLYGPARLVAEGHLPPAVVAQNSEWLRPMVGVVPRGGHFLHFIAFDISRNPDGSWFVLADRTQAPSGAAFALENRVATSRVFPEIFQRSHVHRLADFFRSFRDALDSHSRQREARPAILTPGPLNDTYFEHAYIARYLGFALLEGEDLTVRDGRAMVRTVEGLRAVEVIWRRVDSGFCDPLELDPASRIGTPGLVSALRSGQILSVNAVGSGLVETRAFLAFLPRLAPVLLGEALRMPNIATWWCGQAPERDHARAALARLTVGPALGPRLPFDAAHPTLPGDADPAIAALLESDPAALVAQERVHLSTAPVWEGDGLVPRPMSLRVFLARTAEGWAVMKGGYARIGRGADASAIAMQAGGAVADVWVLSDRPVAARTLVEAPLARPFRSALPARAADNLFWLGRYVERAESATRLARALHRRLAESGGETPLTAALAAHLREQGIDAAAVAPAIADRLDRALACAGRLRDRFSGDGWHALSRLAALAHRMGETMQPGDDAARALSALLRRIAGLAGLVHENMYRSTQWQFLTMGRALERADAMAAALDRFAAPGAPDGGLELVVEIGDSVMTHRRRFPVGIGRETVIDLLALDEDNPRSLLYQLGELRGHIARLPGEGRDGPMSALARAILTLHTDLAVLHPREVDGDRLRDLRARLAQLSDLLVARYFA
jgi:uncharacterized circularly permuted ATP-grasp superfamily protein/uncharacterized alpha-E superfamily protein